MLRVHRIETPPLLVLLALSPRGTTSSEVRAAIDMADEHPGGAQRGRERSMYENSPTSTSRAYGLKKAKFGLTLSQDGFCQTVYCFCNAI